MPTLTKDEIQKRARRFGHTIAFLRSKAVAERIADEVRKQLKKQKVGGTEVEVNENPRYNGAWTVRVLRPLRATGSGLGGAHAETNRRESQAITEILDAAYKPADLLTSWTRPARRR